MAYLSEPPPGRNRSNNFPAWNSFEDYVNGTTTFLQTLYNNETMEINTVGRRDIPTNSFVIRYTMTLPFEIPNRNAFDYYIRMPGAGLYSNGVRAFATNFLTSNETKRNELQPWRMCQHERLLSFTYGEICLWIVKDPEPTQYTVWGAAMIHESAATCWTKFILRCLLSIYVCYVLWTRYYCHYIPLLSNLQRLGVKPEYVRYEIVVGDPLYTILCDPLVVTAIIIDNVWGTGYIILGIMRVSQFHDIWLYVSGCMFLARCIWLSYLGMQIFSFAVKRRQWEAWYAPVDPGFLAIATYIQSGPYMSLLMSTPLVWIFYTAGCFFQPASHDNEAVEAVTATLVVAFLAATLPIPFSRTAMECRRRKRSKLSSID
ncbi:hypothetical protein AC1031_009621 [Aphanomyces cochlioides]|nr:hypothetical protein AC1031_009619 [Aphanomyces cochlioides]KAG9400899.1 hypothetical protein AC1031_009621 [Aphanomyces cochlioides]